MPCPRTRFDRAERVDLAAGKTTIRQQIRRPPRPQIGRAPWPIRPEEKHHQSRPEALGGHSGSAPARGDAVGDQAPACLRQRSAADRRRMVQGDRVPDRDRPEMRRQAPGVHPAVRHHGRQHAGRRHQQPPRRRRDARARSKARSTSRMRRKSPTAPAWPRARPAFRASSPARCAASTAGRSRGAVLDLWQTDGEGLYEEQRRTAEPWMRGIYHSQADGSTAIRTVAPISYTHPDGRPGRRVLQPHQHEPHAAGAHPLRDLGARLPLSRHAPVPEGRRVHQQRRGLRREGRR